MQERLIQLPRLKTQEREDFPNCDVMSSALALLKINISKLQALCLSWLCN